MGQCLTRNWWVCGEQRDATLNLLLRRYVRGEKLADSDWQAAFGADATGEKFAIDLVKQADSAADARLANAEELANNNNLLERIAACQIEVEQLEQGLIDSQAAEEDLDAGWQLLWSDSGVVPGSG